MKLWTLHTKIRWKRLPVVKDDKIVGIVTIKDILERKKYPSACAG